MKARGRRIAAALFAVASLGLAGLSSSSCVGEAELEDFACPSHDVFVEAVSPYLERRCGTLDCHGQATRPMRIYGQFGLRHPDENNISGGAGSTTLERDANWAAVCNVDPEPMQGVTEDRGLSADKLLLVNKARGLERHKGGKIVDEQDAGDRCILNWLRLLPADQVKTACDSAIQPLK
ncbi:hypothetical protein [Polyangium aurulentum]|uniref:hypothetical protein n=1 Tax=Polyangium aurulentum TaxID=2567896 RepID=UPI0010AEB942|nr:hypothetical protein [Polyangium aurulentum]UQA57994.1 hypothetical protein E8A73_043115 [Polyangium aurulentum]